MLEPSARSQELRERLLAFFDRHVLPNEALFHEQIARQRWQVPAIVEELKVKARAEGLWNLFLPESERGAGLTNLEYAPLCEVMGRSPGFGPEVFNCSAPDTGNMEVLARYGTKAQQDAWLTPLLDGRIRSCFSMTEPAVASSDATNIRSTIVARWRRLRDQRPQVVDLRRRRSALQDFDLHGPEQSRRAGRTSGSR